MGALAAGIAAAGQLAQTYIFNRLSRKAIEEAREYESPIQQVRRLKEAGISPSYYLGGGGSFQSTTPRDVTTPDLDLGKFLSTVHQTSIQKAEMEIAKAQARKETAEADIAEVDRDFALKQAVTADYDQQTGVEKIVAQPYTNQERRRILELERLQSTTDIERYRSEYESAKSEQERKRIRENIALAIAQRQLTNTQMQVLKRDIRHYDVIEKIFQGMENKDITQYINGIIRAIVLKYAK